MRLSFGLTGDANGSAAPEASVLKNIILGVSRRLFPFHCNFKVLCGNEKYNIVSSVVIRTVVRQLIG